MSPVTQQLHTRRPLLHRDSEDGSGTAPFQVGGQPLALHVALIEPLIAPNTGNVARLCAATGTSLHLIEPLGFDLDDASLRRAGVDYWDALDLWVHPGWRYFREAVARERCWYLSARAGRSLWDVEPADGACLVFGNEREGLPSRIVEKHPERVVRIPMSGPVRSLNLATAVGIAVYDSLKRLDRPRTQAGART